MNTHTSTFRLTVLAVAAAVVAAIVGLGFMTASTLAARQTEEHVTTQFDVLLPNIFELEGSTDNSEWNQGPGTVATLDFDADNLALEPGEANAVYAPMWVRVAAGSTSAGTATISESGVANTSFGRSLRSEIYAGGTRCAANPDGVRIQSGNLRNSTTDEFTLAGPDGDAPGAPTLVCVKAWMADNDWLLGGQTPPTVTATWTVNGQSN